MKAEHELEEANTVLQEAIDKVDRHEKLKATLSQAEFIEWQSEHAALSRAKEAAVKTYQVKSHALEDCQKEMLPPSAP
jgi:hypothetical protein